MGKTPIGHELILSVAGGLASGLAWYPSCPGIILLVSFIPFFFITDTANPDESVFGSRLIFIRVLPGLLIMNITALAWIRIAGLPLLITAITGNTLLMGITFWVAWFLAHICGREKYGPFLLVFWLTMEYATNKAGLLSPWLNLGNGLAGDTAIIQWYEYTGVAGGTAWILISNIIGADIFSGFLVNRSRKIPVFKTGILLAVILIPIGLSLTILHNAKEETGKPEEVLLLQPCADPYLTKFDIPFSEQMKDILEMADKGVSETTSWVITPETTIDDPIILGNMSANKYIIAIHEFLGRHQNLAFILGATTRSAAQPAQLHNSAIMLSNNDVENWYHKSRLVPGIEKSFTPALSILQSLFPRLGGSSGGFTGQDEPSPFTHPVNHISAGPVICFESAFGGQVAASVKNGASFIIVITNDGWWKGTYGYYQHLTFSSLRAIETRRYVARAANTGISAIISPDGKITDSLGWWERGTIKGVVYPAYRQTFYVRYDDLIYKAATAIAALIVTIAFIVYPLIKKIRKYKEPFS